MNNIKYPNHKGLTKIPIWRLLLYSLILIFGIVFFLSLSGTFEWEIALIAIVTWVFVALVFSAIDYSAKKIAENPRKLKYIKIALIIFVILQVLVVIGKFL